MNRLTNLTLGVIAGLCSLHRMDRLAHGQTRECASANQSNKRLLLNSLRNNLTVRSQLRLKITDAAAQTKETP